jgi:hypothetical protein
LSACFPAACFARLLEGLGDPRYRLEPPRAQRRIMEIRGLGDIRNAHPGMIDPPMVVGGHFRLSGRALVFGHMLKGTTGLADRSPLFSTTR